MNISQFRPLVLGAIAGLALMACNKAESPSAVSNDVQDAQVDKTKNVADAQANQIGVQAETAKAAGSANADDRGDAIQDRAAAEYKTAVAKAEGDYKIAKEACESTAGSVQSACKKTAEATYETAKSNATVARDAERRRGDVVQKLNN
jgi:hypothetical protein